MKITGLNLLLALFIFGCEKRPSGPVVITTVVTNITDTPVLDSLKLRLYSLENRAEEINRDLQNQAATNAQRFEERTEQAIAVSFRQRAAEEKIKDLELQLQNLQSLTRQKEQPTNRLHFLGEDEAYTVVPNETGSLLVLTKAAVPYLDGFKVTLHIGNPQMVTFREATLQLAWGPKDVAQALNLWELDARARYPDFGEVTEHGHTAADRVLESLMALRTNKPSASVNEFLDQANRALAAAAAKEGKTAPNMARSYAGGESHKSQKLLQPLDPGVWTPVEVVITPATADDLRTLRVSISTTSVSLKAAR